MGEITLSMPKGHFVTLAFMPKETLSDLKEKLRIRGIIPPGQHFKIVNNGREVRKDFEPIATFAEKQTPLTVVFVQFCSNKSHYVDIELFTEGHRMCEPCRQKRMRRNEVKRQLNPPSERGKRRGRPSTTNFTAARTQANSNMTDANRLFPSFLGSAAPQFSSTPLFPVPVTTSWSARSQILQGGPSQEPAQASTSQQSTLPNVELSASTQGTGSGQQQSDENNEAHAMEQDNMPNLNDTDASQDGTAAQQQEGEQLSADKLTKDIMTSDANGSGIHIHVEVQGLEIGAGQFITWKVSCRPPCDGFSESSREHPFRVCYDDWVRFDPQCDGSVHEVNGITADNEMTRAMLNLIAMSDAELIKRAGTVAPRLYRGRVIHSLLGYSDSGARHLTRASAVITRKVNQ
eukprot:Colp12_sorted_trinity150504_noHs@81